MSPEKSIVLSPEEARKAVELASLAQSKGGEALTELMAMLDGEGVLVISNTGIDGTTPEASISYPIVKRT